VAKIKKNVKSIYYVYEVSNQGKQKPKLIAAFSHFPAHKIHIFIIQYHLSSPLVVRLKLIHIVPNVIGVSVHVEVFAFGWQFSLATRKLVN